MTITILLTFCSLSIYLSSCTQAPQLPKDAQEALHMYWLSIPSAPGIENHITRVRAGTTSSGEFSSWVPETEIWCVEAQITSSEDSKIDGERLIWIVFRENKTMSWSVSMLAAMSSTWPYEACQK